MGTDLVVCILGVVCSALWPTAAPAASDADIALAIETSGLKPQTVRVKNGQGRIDVDPANKRSYYVFTPNPADPQSPTYVIPLSTVRYTTSSYSTPGWWAANKDAIAVARAERKPTPVEAPEAVREFLKTHNLSTNPDVLIVGAGGKFVTQPLQTFLLAEYRKQGERVKLFRGSLRATEQGEWESGKMAWGSQYYTPSAPYGWRYARKMPGAPFLELANEGKAPLFQFGLPYEEFEAMVKNGQLTLGVELPKSAHDRFDRGGVFRDALYGDSLYLGDPTFGLEFEITATKPARQRLVTAYEGSVGPGLLGEKAVEQISIGAARLGMQFPDGSLHDEAEALAELLEGGSGSRGIYLPDDLKSCVRRFRELNPGVKR